MSYHGILNSRGRVDDPADKVLRIRENKIMKEVFQILM
jgi:hypothetical protein